MKIALFQSNYQLKTIPREDNETGKREDGTFELSRFNKEKIEVAMMFHPAAAAASGSNRHLALSRSSRMELAPWFAPFVFRYRRCRASRPPYPPPPPVPSPLSFVNSLFARTMPGLSLRMGAFK